MKKVLGILRQFQQHTDEGSTNRDWNITTNLVITGKALMQIHGDWMKGEFRNAGKEAGKDFGCINIPGAQAVSVTVDAWGFIKNDDPAITESQKKFAADAGGSGDFGRVCRQEGLDPGRPQRARPISSTNATRSCSTR